MSIAFHDRQAELGALDAIDARKGAQLVAVFGRRRIGKTALLVRWIERTGASRSVYWVAHRSTSPLLLAAFSRALQPLLGTRDPSFSLSSWEAALEEVARLAEKKPLVVVIDELPYLLESVPSFATILQATWDHALARSRVRLLLAGSHYHMMHEAITAQKGPLFGRATATLSLDEINFHDTSFFLPRYSLEQRVETYSIVGGVPTYLQMWDDRRPVLQNIRDLILAPETIFRNEPLFLIQDEISDPRTYIAILEGIGSGARRPVEIALSSGVNLAHVGKYLHTLESLRFTRRVVSLEARHSRVSRSSRYEIRDPYLRFYYAFMQPNLRLLEQGRVDRVLEVVRRGLDAHVGRVGYEEICRRYVAMLADRSELPFEAVDVGHIWDRRSEIDVAALSRDRRAVLVAECRWRRKKMSEADLDKLIDKAAGLSKLRGAKFTYCLFSRAGFTTSLARRAARESVMLFEGVPGLRN